MSLARSSVHGTILVLVTGDAVEMAFVHVSRHTLGQIATCVSRGCKVENANRPVNGTLPVTHAVGAGRMEAASAMRVGRERIARNVQEVIMAIPVRRSVTGRNVHSTVAVWQMAFVNVCLALEAQHVSDARWDTTGRPVMCIA